MRWVALALILLVPGAFAQELFFVGTGEDYVIITEPSASLALFAPSNFEISADGHGGALTTYETHPGNDVDENGLIPTFLYSGTPIVLTASDVLFAHHFATMRAGGGTGVECGLTAHLYDADGEVLAENYQASTEAGTTQQEFVFQLSGVEGTFDVLKLQFVQTGSGTGGSDICGNAGIVHAWGSDASPGRLIVPAPAPSIQEASTVFDALDTSAYDATFTNATSDTYHLNFTTDLVNSTANFTWNATSGSVDATLTDANGTVVFNGTLEGNGTLTPDILNATAGAWNLTLAYTDFTGTLAFDLSARSPPGGSNGTVDTGTTDSQTTGPDSNQTENLDDTKDTPLPVIVPMLAALAAVALRRRP